LLHKIAENITCKTNAFDKLVGMKTTIRFDRHSAKRNNKLNTNLLTAVSFVVRISAVVHAVTDVGLRNAAVRGRAFEQIRSVACFKITTTIKAAALREKKPQRRRQLPNKVENIDGTPDIPYILMGWWMQPTTRGSKLLNRI